MRLSHHILAVTLISALIALPTPAHAQSGDAETWALVEDLKIGSVNSPDYALNQIQDLAIGRDGRIYVAQFLEPSVRVFDRDGGFVQRIGREGAGPGEFRDVSALGWRGDSLWVRDAALGRLSFFDAGGAFLGSAEFRKPLAGDGSGTIAPGHPMADGSLAVVPSAASHLIANGTIREMPIALTGRDGTLRGTLGHISMEHKVALILFDKGGTSGPQPFSDAPLWRAAADGESIWVIERPSSTYPERGWFELHRISLAGDTVVSRRYRYTPKPMPSVLVDSVVGMHVRRIQSGPARGVPAPKVEEWVRAAFFLPAFQMPITEVVAGDDGRLWIRREEPSDGG